MKILIVTVAGLSARFSQSLGYSCLKCLYYENRPEESLLHRMLCRDSGFDRWVIVGGFLYEELENALKRDFGDFQDKITLVKNDHYADYGSGYSLYLALDKIKDMDFSEAVFAEGDLYVDRDSFRKVCSSPRNVITCSQEPILANKAVAFYFDAGYGIHYIYDTEHSALEIREPFLGIFNSGQIWKFADPERLRRIVESAGEREKRGTNLELIQRYFGDLSREQYEIVTFKQWINCNTVSDYRMIEADE